MKPNQSSSLELAVISGIHCGARHRLRLGTCLIGSGSHCDLILREPGVADEHVRLEVKKRQVQVHRLANETPGVAGPSTDDSRTWQWLPGEVLALATAQLQLERSTSATAESNASKWFDAFGSRLIMAVLVVAATITLVIVQTDRASAQNGIDRKSVV